MNELYQMYNSNAMNGNSGYTNPVMKVMHAMSNPIAVIKQAWPDIPDQMLNNPMQILNYIQRTRNIPSYQLQNIMRQYPFS